MCIFVQGFSLKTAHAGNQDRVVVFNFLILVQGFSIKSGHVGHAYDFFRSDNNNECAFSYKDSLEKSCHNENVVFLRCAFSYKILDKVLMPEVMIVL